jgi:geranylgeranylglycerol-phosphate geranylgeranyltransferase
MASAGEGGGDARAARRHNRLNSAALEALRRRRASVHAPPAALRHHLRRRLRVRVGAQSRPLPRLHAPGPLHDRPRLCASFLNAASNAINQIYDLEIDRINKPSRPLVTGALSLRQAWAFTWVTYALAIVPTWLVVVHPYNSAAAKLFAPLRWHECFFIYLAGMIFTFVYSAPAFGRTKRHAILANVTIAIPRGCLLKVAGWTMVAHANVLEPWFIGAIFMLFLLGAASTKDFSDIEGDAAGGCRTLPIRFGVRRAAYLIAPFFVFPWLLMPLGARLGILTGNHTAIAVLGFGLAAWGAYTVWLIVRNPDELTATENHPSWRHMYLMMMTAQIGFAVAYLV